jgi:hypothetical protein
MEKIIKTWPFRNGRLDWLKRLEQSNQKNPHEMLAPKPAAYTTTHPAAAVLVVITNQNKKNSKSKKSKIYRQK